jgi:hypothetical protein
MTPWPSLPYEEWSDTLDTLHMYTQVIGKVRLALSPLEPEWANVALYVTPRGLTTSAVPFGQQNFDAELDFLDHEVFIRSSDGEAESIPLRGQDVADFYHEVLAALGRLGVSVTITELPQEVPNPIPFSDDRVHHTYDPTYAHRFWQVLVRVDNVMKEHRAAFRGKTSPVHFFWGSFDLATTRFSGLPADPPPGAGVIMRRAEDAEQISVGFWAGDERTPYPAFYAYGYPKPAGCETVVCRPEGASWVEQAGLFVLPYEAVRTAEDPRRAVLEFLESTYEACAALMHWSPDLVEHKAGQEGNDHA